MRLSIFKGWTDETPVSISLDAIVEMMRTDASLKDLTEKHRYYLSIGQKSNAKYYKQRMPCFAVAVRFEGGKAKDNIAALTGLTIVDIDDIPSHEMTRVLDLIRKDPHTLLSYTTISGNGIRVITRYAFNVNEYDDDNDNANEDAHPASALSLYKESFLQVNAYYTELTGLKSDPLCKNATRLSGIAYDEQLFYNPQAEPFKVKMKEKRSIGRPRAKRTVEQVERHIDRELERRGIRYEQGSHNNYISQAGYLMNRFGVAEADCVEWALERFADYAANGNDVPGIIHSCYQQTDEHATRQLPREKRDSYATVAEIQEYLIVKNIRIRLNRISRKWEILDTRSDNTTELRTTVNENTAELYENDNDNDDENENENENCLRTETVDRRPLTVDHDNELRLTVDHNNENVNVNENENLHPDGLTVDRRLLTVDNNKSDFNRSAASLTGTEGAYSHKTLNRKWVELTDRHVNSIYRAFSLDTNRRLRLSDLVLIIESDFYPVYNPMHEYLNTLPPWNGRDYIEELASTVHVAGNKQEMHNRLFKKWFVAMIAAWIESDKTNHEILTYIGAQGIYKSTFMRKILPPELRDYFSARNFAHRMGRDDRLELTEMALIALEELDNMKPQQVNQLKAITTDPSVNERAAYARYRERRDHISSFCGTGNNPRFLTDLTGNRRWLPFLINSIESPYEHPFNYTGLYSQAYALWRNGFAYWLSHDENAELEIHNREFEDHSMEEELIQTYFRKPNENEVGEFYTATRIIETINMAVKTPLSARNIAIWMNRLGYQQRRHGNVRGWNVILLSMTDIKLQQQEKARTSSLE